MIRLGILGSTRGTNLLALIKAINESELQASIALVLSNREEAIILERAKNHGLKTQFLSAQGLSREQYDAQISQQLVENDIELVVLIGYMRLLSASFVTQWKNKVINVHPSLLPAFAGLMDLEVHKAVLESGHKETGCTVHYVTEEVDAGPILVQKKCHVLREDTPDSLKAKVQALEGEALIAAIKNLEFRQQSRARQ